MPNNFENAFHELLKLVVHEVVSELQSKEHLSDHKKSEQGSGSDDRLLLRDTVKGSDPYIVPDTLTIK